MNSTEIITITFCCFLLLMLIVGVGCVYKMYDNEQGVWCLCVNVYICISVYVWKMKPK